MSGLINFRDFGGYPTKDGTNIKKGIFYRGGSYRDLTESDRKYIQSLGIQNLHDYREEMELDTDEKQSELAKRAHIISASAYLGGFERDEEAEYDELTSDSMIEFYEQIPFGNPAYKNVFKVLQEDNAVPYLHNCTAGKDRTGLASALILSALNVDYHIIMSDYMKSMNAYNEIFNNEVRRLTNGRGVGSLLYKMPGLVIMPKYLDASFNAIFTKYGSLENYFLEEFGMDEKAIQDLRGRYTVKK